MTRYRSICVLLALALPISLAMRRRDLDKPNLVCEKCGKKVWNLAQYAGGWGGAFSGGLYGPNVCSECAPKGGRVISATV